MADKTAEKSAPTGFAGLIQKAKFWRSENDKVEQVPANDYAMGYDGTTVAMLMGSQQLPARSRAEIYQQQHYMSSTAVISSAMRLHVTAALGGHETTGDVVFIEPTAEGKGADESTLNLLKELQTDLGPLFNRVAYQMAFNGAVFGDAYARAYTRQGEGLIDIYTGEMVFPPLVQPYEQGNRTVGFVVSTGERMNEKLTVLQMARLKMPRMNWTAQMRVVQKAQETALEEDDIERLKVLPSMAGGSLLEGCETAFNNLMQALAGLLGQRVLDSIDETILGVNMEGTTKEQRLKYTGSIKAVLQASKARADEAVKMNRPILQRFYHILPTWAEKTLTSMQPFGSGKQGNYSIEDVMFHAKVLSGALGIDLSMLGFSDLLSGGLGDGGFFRVSAQSAERARVIRSALSEFYDRLVDIHTMARYGWTFKDKQRPYRINFYGSISAMETEKQRTKENQMNAALGFIQALVQLKDLGIDKKATSLIISKHMGADEDEAEVLAGALEHAASEAKKAEQQANGGFGGADPGGDGEVVPPKIPEEEE